MWIIFNFCYAFRGDAMTGDSIQWSKDYEIGVWIIDHAHEELFRISKRLIMLGQEPAKHKWIAEEGIKFLKVYVMRHFGEEEAYMRQIDYPHITGHIHQHALMRDKILPRMESSLRHAKFSQESIDSFLNVLRLWLGRHILVHDLALRKAAWHE